MGASSCALRDLTEELAPMGRSYGCCGRRYCGKQPDLPWLVGANTR